MEVWDDLWFWGFINQRGSGLNREFIWNEAKYWALIETAKDKKSINSIRATSLVFLKLFDNKLP
ncbi:hypothetical protein EVU94_02745 [Flavobacteriaceae bacterium 144Ye]|nr:hypothetical protein EVU94_02745 [Flavobacteriaceae bacterium 144Ye]